MKNLLKISFIACLTLAITLAFTSAEKRTIVLDVSHGGKDAGTSINGADEKAIALEIANKVKALNKNANIDIVLTRDEDKFVPLIERAEYINSLEPELVISLHVNSSKNIEKRGTEIFVSDNNTENKKSNELASKLKSAFENQSVSIKKGDLYLLKNVKYPIAVLEIGFLSNADDRAILTSDDGQMKIANSILKAIK